MKKLFLFSMLAFALLSVAAAAQDAKVIKYYDSKTYFEGQQASRITYDYNLNKIYCTSVDTKDANTYHYSVWILENGEWKQFNTPEHGYPYGDTLWVKEIGIDKYSRIWITTSDGFLKYEKDKWEKIITEDIEGLKVKSYKAIIPDSLGNVFFQISYGYKYPSGITNIIQSNLYKYQDETNSTILIYSCDSTNFVDNPEHLSSMNFKSYCADNQGSIWLASGQHTNPYEGVPKRKSLMSYNSGENKYEFYEMINQVKNEYLTSITPKHLSFIDNSLWLVHGNSQRGGISRLNLNSGEWSHIENFEGMNNLHGALTRLDKMVTDRDEAIWASSTGWGLLKFDLVNKTLKRLNFEDILNQGKLSLKINDIYDLIKDGDGNNWFATGAGIVVLEGKKNTFAEDPQKLSVNIFPNPASEYISITGLEINTGARIEIYSQLDVKLLDAASGTDKLDISKLPVGVYVLKAGGKATKFIKI